MGILVGKDFCQNVNFYNQEISTADEEAFYRNLYNTEGTDEREPFYKIYDFVNLEVGTQLGFKIFLQNQFHEFFTAPYQNFSVPTDKDAFNLYWENAK